MRAKQRKLLGILGALAVPIALVVGLYTDSGDLFKGYLTFEQNPEEIAQADETTVRGYLTSVLNGDFDANTDEVTSGFFHDYFTGGTDASGNAFFDNTRCIAPAGPNFDATNLADQAILLGQLLQDRSDSEYIQNFLQIKVFYNREFGVNKQLLKLGGLALDVTEETPSFISYEDIQKTILVNYMAYKTAGCVSGFSKYHTATDELISLNDLENNLFKYDTSFKERQISATTLGSNSEKVVTKHLIASSQSVFAEGTSDADKFISLRNEEETREFSAITTAQTAANEDLAALNNLSQPDFDAQDNRSLYSTLLTSLNGLSTDLESSGLYEEFVAGDKLDQLDDLFTLAQGLSIDDDLAYDITEKATAYTNAVAEINDTEAINYVMLPILGFDMTGLTTALIDAYIEKIERQTVESAFEDLDATALLTAVDNLDPNNLEAKATALTSAITTYNGDTGVAAARDEASIGAIATAQAEYLMHLQKSINDASEIDNDPSTNPGLEMLSARQELMLNLANIAKFVLEEIDTPVVAVPQIGTPSEASTAVGRFVDAKRFSSINFGDTIDDNITDTVSHFGQDDSTFKDPSQELIGAFQELFQTVTQTQEAYNNSNSKSNLKDTVHEPFERIAEGLFEIIDEISLNTNFDVQEIVSDSYNIDMRAGSSDNGGFPENLTIKTDLRDAEVDVALIQVENKTDNQIKIDVTPDVLASTINVAESLLRQQDKVTGGGYTEALAGKNYRLNVMYSQDPTPIEGFSGQVDLSGLNSDQRNFRGLADDVEIEDRINPNFSQILIVEISSDGGQEHNFISGSKKRHLEKQYQLYVFNDKISKTAELDPTTNVPNEVVIGTELSSVITTFAGNPTLPNSNAPNSAFYALAAQTADCTDRTKLLHKDIPATIQNGNVQIVASTLEQVSAGTYHVCFAIYDDNYESAETDITFVEPTPEDPGAEGGEDQPGAISEVDSTNAIASDVTLELTGENLSTDEADYQLARQDNAVAATAINVTQDNQDDTRYIVQFGEVLPGSYQLAYKRERQEGFVNVDNLKVLNPNNNSVIGASNPEISFECLSDYTYNATLKNTVDNTVQQFTDIECNSNVAVFKVEQALSKGVRYTLEIVIVDELGNELEGLFDSHRFSTSNNFLLTPEQAAVLDFTCGRQIAESKDANGIPIPGKKNVVIKGTKTNCAVTNPFPQAGISAGYMVKIGANTPQTDAVAMQAIQGGFAATNILVPAESSDYYIYVLVPGTNSNEFVKTNSFVTPYESNGSVDKETAEGDIEDLIDVSMPNTIEIGESIDLEIDIPENLDVHMMVVRYQGNEDDRDTRDFSGPVFIYCQEDITDNFEKNRDRRKIDRICDRFYEDDILEGPDTIEIEDFDTSRIGAEGLYDIKIDLFVDAATLPAEALSKGDSTTAYAQGIEIKQLRLTIEEAFEAENRQLGGGSRAFIDGRAMLASGVNFQYPPMHTAIPVQTQQCQTVFRDLNVSHQICKDIMYLYEQKLYSGVRMGNNIVSGVNDAAVRAHLFSFIERVLKTYRKVPNYGINYQALYKFQDVKQYLNDPVQQWWLAPAATLATYGFVQGDANYNLNPFGRVTQAQAAKLIGMATGLIPPELQQKSPWYADIVAQYITYGMNLNPNAPATLGDLVVILSRSIQIMKNPNLFNTINQFAGNTHVGLY